MNNIVRIFRKDLRSLWPQIGLLWISAAFSTPLRSGGQSLTTSLFPMLPVLACWLLIVSTIHQEPLVGDRQYWLTRPFTWRDLLGAKALFLAVFINVPLFALQARALSSQGLSPLSNLPMLLWNQLFFTVFMVLPAASLGAVTRNLGQAVLGVIMMIAGPLLFLTVFGGINFGSAPSYAPAVQGLGWVDATAAALLVFLVTGFVLFFQYTRRMVMPGRVLLALTPVLALLLVSQISTETAFGIQSLFSPVQLDPAAVRISLDARPSVRPASQQDEDEVEPAFARLDLPIRFDQLPAGANPVLDMIEPRIESSAGSWRPPAMQGKLHHWSNGSGWLTIYVGRTYFDRVKDLSADLSGSIDLTLFQTISTVKVRDVNPVHLPGDLTCTFNLLPGWSACVTPFARVAVTAIQEGASPDAGVPVVPRTQAYGPYRVSPGFSPLEEINRGGVMAVPGKTYLLVEKPLSYVRRQFSFRGIHLGEYLWK